MGKSRPLLGFQLTSPESTWNSAGPTCLGLVPYARCTHGRIRDPFLGLWTLVAECVEMARRCVWLCVLGRGAGHVGLPLQNIIHRIL